MNKLELEGKWNQIKGSVKQKFGDWFDNDDTSLEGKFEEIVGKIQEKTGKTVDEIEDTIRNWVDNDDENQDKKDQPQS
ncbi:CsbD family protein [Algoriella sp.]|uniref:CsbD family protein n=1 Tax=Algoriella sp. TaxID=1872434 RepID=UPI002FCC1411